MTYIFELPFFDTILELEVAALSLDDPDALDTRGNALGIILDTAILLQAGSNLLVREARFHSVRIR